MSEVAIEIKGLLFDMDGVLISSIASVNRCWKLWAAHYGVADAQNVQIAHGVRAVDLIKGYKPGFTEAEVTEGLRYIEDLEIADTEGLKVLAGVRELLASLPPERWTIVTSATRRLLLGRLKAAGLPYPDRLIAADDVVNGKPHPEPYMKGAEILGFSTKGCVVVEDAPSGVGAGVAAGARVLGVLGTHTAEEIYAAGATWVARSLESVKVTVVEGGLRVEFEAV
ncbi:HAD-IA family hydrolase [Granulicella tundricola]|uniref:HAD-superfamily hydrolase, subfamily IA, variant 3 n=1 Tax=Granulicella tundricola (strain ATCC BAA-1859 / DSM 23138 / MP5ACTX9) TaxID=1198114 RepID=E8WYE9_GRATM|nr:HAD-IA family hydrolase [Granulicella tundricola]ADW69855.1 HAD-superfamily hydrolase, subfamily IA, variant 3 [Granulicella tundricola MP5ACTX9]